MPASTGSHCSRCVSQRGLMVDELRGGLGGVGQLPGGGVAEGLGGGW